MGATVDTGSFAIKSTVIALHSAGFSCGRKCDVPDLVILDILLAGNASGWTLLDQLRQSKRTAAVPIIVCSAATAEVQAHQAALRDHGIRLLAKPFDLDDLLRLVSETLRTAEGDHRGCGPAFAVAS
jgi:CheY-like chemotaxis protein